MQVAPIKPTLKAHGYKRLKLNKCKLLLSVAFNLNLRRYNEDNTRVRKMTVEPCQEGPSGPPGFYVLAGGILPPPAAAGPAAVPSHPASISS